MRPEVANIIATSIRGVGHKETGMSKHRKLQSITLLTSLVASVFVGAFPAYAVAPTATASVDVSEVIAGAQETFHFDVSNTGAPAGDLPLPGEEGDLAINWVRIRPQDFSTFSFNPDSAVADGWTASLQDLDQDGDPDAALFKAGTIGPGDTSPFTLIASADGTPVDQVVNWVVQVSNDNGATTAGSSSAGNLSTTIRVLSVTNNVVSAPVGVLDGSATAGQTGLTVTSTVTNHGTGTLDVDPSLVSNSSGDTITDQGPASIASGASQPFPFPVDLGSSTATREFTGDATAPGADAIERVTGALIAEAPADFTYTGGSLSPIAAVSGSAQTFTLNVAKSNPPAVNFDVADSVLTFTRGEQSFSTSLVSPPSSGRDNGSLELTFATIAIPGDPTARDFDGSYSLDLTLLGVDDNGAAVDREVSIGDTFDIDNLMPFVTPIIDGPAGQVTREGVPSVKTGDLLTFSGEIRHGSAPSDPSDPTAQIIVCDVVVTDDAGLEVERNGVPLSDCSNNGGNITGSAPLTSTIESGRAYLELVVQDAAGNTTPATESVGFVAIDNLVPVFDRALTGCGDTGGTCDPNTTIRLFLSEPVKAPLSPISAPDGLPAPVQEVADTVTNTATPPLFLPADFAVSGNQVTNAMTLCDGMWCDRVTLTVAQAFGDDDNPDVDYVFIELPIRSRAQDAVAHELGDQLIQTIDGIVPDLPTLATVTQDGVDAGGNSVQNERGLQDGEFYSNQDRPTFAIEGLGVGYLGIIALDRNENGDYDPLTDTAIAECVSEGSVVSCQTDEAHAFVADGPYALLVASRDEQGNLSEGRAGALAGKHGVPVTLVIDNAAPVATGFVPAGVTDLSVSFDDPLAAGRDFAEDWIARELLDNGKFRGYDAAAVSGTDASRTVTIDSSGGYVQGAADDLLYTFQGTADLRYQDRAGNYLGNFILPASL